MRAEIFAKKLDISTQNPKIPFFLPFTKRHKSHETLSIIFFILINWEIYSLC